MAREGFVAGVRAGLGQTRGGGLGGAAEGFAGKDLDRRSRVAADLRSG